MGPATPGHCSNSGCHGVLRAGFRCGADKAECYAGLDSAGLIDDVNPGQSRLVKVNESPLSWFGGGMPIDDPSPNAQAAAAINAWVAAGAKNN